MLLITRCFCAAHSFIHSFVCLLDRSLVCLFVGSYLWFTFITMLALFPYRRHSHSWANYLCHWFVFIEFRALLKIYINFADWSWHQCAFALHTFATISDIDIIVAMILVGKQKSYASHKADSSIYEMCDIDVCTKQNDCSFYWNRDRTLDGSWSFHPHLLSLLCMWAKSGFVCQCFFLFAQVLILWILATQNYKISLR